MGHGHHTSIDDVPQCHVQIVVVNNLGSRDVEDAMKVLGMVILRAKLAQRWAYEFASSRYSGRLAMFTTAMYLAPLGRGRHASHPGWMPLGSGQLLVLVFTTNSLGGSGSGRCAWQGSSHCPPHMVFGGGSPEGYGCDDDDEGPLHEGPAPDDECPQLSSQNI
jgi:hypothetical protein